MDLSESTLVQSYKRTPKIFDAISKSKNQLMYFSISINKQRLCRGSKSYFISKRRMSCKDEVRVKVPSFLKIHTFFYNIKRSVETLSVYILLV